MRSALLFTLALTGLAAAAQKGPTSHAVAEQTGLDEHVITFDAPQSAFPVGIFGIQRPGRAGAGKELVKAGQPRVEVRLPAGSGQPFFRLKPKKGGDAPVLLHCTSARDMKKLHQRLLE